MKKIVILFVILVMVFAFTIPASASGNGPVGGNVSSGLGSGSGQGQQRTHGNFTIIGTIAAIGANTVTIDVLHGNKPVHPYLGTQVTVTVTSETRYLYGHGSTTTTIGFADLQVGQSVNVHGTLTNSIWTVSLIILAPR